MKLTYDEKGKFFTDRIPKVALPVIIQTQDFIVKGDIHLTPEERLIDELNSSAQFIAVTDAIVYTHSGEEIYRANFLSLNLLQVVLITPIEDMTVIPKLLGGA